MALSETGQYVGSVVDEIGRRRFNSLLEDGRAVFTLTSSGLSNVSASDVAHTSDRATLFVHRCNPNVFVSAIRGVLATDAQQFSDVRVAAQFHKILDSLAISDSASRSINSAQISDVAPADTVLLLDGATILVHRCRPNVLISAIRHEIATDKQDIRDNRLSTLSKIVGDALSMADSAALTTISGSLGQATVATSEVQHISDSFLSRLLRNLRATDAVDFQEQVALALITRELRFFDNVDITDEALLERIGQILAGIRTFTCTPGYDIQRDAITKTGVADFDQPGLFSVANGAARPAYKFVINIPALTRTQAQCLSAFHFFHQGAKAFYIDGFIWSSVTTLNLIGEGNGVNKEFFLPNRNIGAGSITVAVFDGATHSITTAFSLNATPGIIAFTTAPSSGHDIEASHGHVYKVVFEPEGLKLDEFAMGVFKAQLKLREMAV